MWTMEKTLGGHTIPESNSQSPRENSFHPQRKRISIPFPCNLQVRWILRFSSCALTNPPPSSGAPKRPLQTAFKRHACLATRWGRDKLHGDLVSESHQLGKPRKVPADRRLGSDNKPRRFGGLRNFSGKWCSKWVRTYKLYNLLINQPMNMGIW